jgi:hypothetical protein
MLLQPQADKQHLVDNECEVQRSHPGSTVGVAKAKPAAYGTKQCIRSQPVPFAYLHLPGKCAVAEDLRP